MDDLEHWPRLGDNLLGPDDSRKFHIDLAPDQGDRLAGGFKEAGDATLQAFVESHGRYRDLLLPALYCYRQFLELKLKHILTRINFHYGTDYTKFLWKHNLEALWSDIKAAFTEAEFELDDQEKATQDQVERCILELHGLDPAGTGFRYPEERRPLEVDPYHLHKVMSDIEWYLDAFLDFATFGER